MELTQIMGIPTDARLTGSAIDRFLKIFYWTIVRQGSWAVDLFIVLVSHFLFIHYLNPNWFNGINPPAYSFMVLVGIPPSIACAYLFHQLIERHFMPTVHAKRQNDFPAESALANAAVS